MIHTPDVIILPVSMPQGHGQMHYNPFNKAVRYMDIADSCPTGPAHGENITSIELGAAGIRYVCNNLVNNK